MLVKFENEKARNWAVDSTRLFQSKMMYEYSYATEFSRFKHLSPEARQKVLDTHKALVQKINDWRSQIIAYHSLRIGGADIDLFAEILMYRPYQFNNPLDYVSEQLVQLQNATQID